MSFLGTGFGASGSYSITNSARFNGSGDYLSKTLTTSATTSCSVWVKRSKLGATSPIFDNKVYFTSGDALYAFGLTSTALYRDPSAWYHVFWNGTGVYVNGTLVTGSGSYTAASVTNPRLGYDGTNYFSGYLSDFAFWNGSSASLQGGATDSNGVWAARKPAAGYSYLAFGSAGALGTDSSGNGNTWTVTGSPVQATDTPTNNYATLSPLDSYGSGTYLSAGSNKVTVSIGTYGIWRATQRPASGLWYAEFTYNANPSGNTEVGIGVVTNSRALNSASTPGNNTTDWVIRGDGSKVYNSVATGILSAFVNTDVAQVAWDATNGQVWFGRNGTWNGNPSAGTGAAFTGITAGAVLAIVAGDVQTITANFGATSFAYTVPTGFKALNTANLPSVAVTTSGTFTGNANADGPFVWTNGNPATLTINGNAVTFGTHADKTAGGFKLRTSSASYNTSGSNTWTATAGKRFVYSATSINNAQGNP